MPDLEVALRAKTRLHLYAATRLHRPLGTAVVLAFEEDRLVLEVDPRDMKEANLESGASVFLGFGAALHGMLAVSRSTVVGLDNNVLTVERPSEPFKMPRRDYARAPVQWSFQVVAGGSESQWTSVNISAGGALLAPPAGLALPDLGTVLGVRFSIPSWQDVETRARCLRHDRLPQTSAMAIQFLDLDEISETKIQLRALRVLGRRYLRVRLATTARIGIDGSVLDCNTIDLSASGVLLALSPCSNELSLSSEPTSLRIDVTDGGPPIQIGRCRIVRCTERDGKPCIALHFVEIDPEEQDRISAIVMETILSV